MIPFNRENLIDSLHTALERVRYVDAAWIGGSDAFGQVDHFSDIDLLAVVADDHLDNAFAEIEAAIEELTTIKACYKDPNGVGYQQRFYRFRDAPEFMVLDACFIARSNPVRFLERELHGEPVVLFDKTGTVRSIPLDVSADREEAMRRVPVLKAAFEMMQHVPKKEIQRGNPVEAFYFYQTLTLKPLVEALRLKYCPHLRSFHVRYLNRDMPPSVASRIQRLSYVADLKDLAVKRDEAEAWFQETVAALESLLQPSA